MNRVAERYLVRLLLKAVIYGWFESVYRQQNKSKVQSTLFRQSWKKKKNYKWFLLKKIWFNFSVSFMFESPLWVNVKETDSQNCRVPEITGEKLQKSE